MKKCQHFCLPNFTSLVKRNVLVLLGKLFCPEDSLELALRTCKAWGALSDSLGEDSTASWPRGSEFSKQPSMLCDLWRAVSRCYSLGQVGANLYLQDELFPNTELVEQAASWLPNPTTWSPAPGLAPPFPFFDLQSKQVTLTRRPS